MTGQNADSSANENDITELIKMKNGLFSFDYKGDQEKILDELIKAPYSIFYAPTGYGKTFLGLISLLVHIFSGKCGIKNGLVLTKTKTQVFKIMDEIAKILAVVKKKVLLPGIIIVPLIAKEELCIHPAQPKGGIDCERLQCPYYYKSLPYGQEFGMILNAYSEQTFKSSSNLKQFLTTVSNGGCPYYLLQKIRKHALVIVTTHAWVLNPVLRDILLTKLPCKPEQTALIIDEVHNFLLPHTMVITAEEADAACTLAKKYHLDCQQLLEQLPELIKAPKVHVSRNLVDPKHQSKIIDLLDSSITKIRNLSILSPEDRKGLRGLEALVTFVRSDGNYWYFDTTKDKNGQTLKVLGHTQTRMSMYFQLLADFKRTLFMSATIYDLQIYKSVFGLKDVALIEARLPFKTTLLAILMNDRFCARQKNRNVYLLIDLVKVIHTLHHLSPDHTLVFSSSHQFTKNLVNINTRFYHEDIVIAEDTSARNQSILDELRVKDHHLLYATFNGSFSEGIEIIDPMTKKSKITLIIFASLPFSPPSITQDLTTADYFVQYDKNANIAKFLSEYLPLYQTVLQAAGRSIRNPTDKCVIVCLDWRLFQLEIFPPESIVRVNQPEQLLPVLKWFYKNQL